MAAVGVVALVLLGSRLGESIEGLCAGALLATAGASPFAESFTLAGELVATVPTLLALLAFVEYLRRGRGAWLLAAGLLAGCALMVKQSAADALLAALLYLVIRRGRRALLPAALLLAAAAAPLAAGAATAPHPADWWNAVVAYRGHGDSLLTGSLSHRLDLFGSTLPAAAKALGLLALLAAVGWGRAPLLARVWLPCAALGVLGGGNFHAHYYIQLAPPLSLLAAYGVVRLVRERRLVLGAAAVTAAAATLGFTLSLALEAPDAQARTIWPGDPHLVRDRPLARYVRAHTAPDEPILVVWASADLYYLADRPPAIPYLWLRSVQSLPDAPRAARRALLAGVPALVVEAQSPDVGDPSGATARILSSRYRVVARVDGTPVLGYRAP